MNFDNQCSDCDYWFDGLCRMPEIAYNEPQCNLKTNADSLGEMFHDEKECENDKS